jgi:hypothetical protein
MSQMSFEQRIGISARKLNFDNGTMRALVAKEVPVVDVDAVVRQAELLKTGAELATGRDQASAEVLLRSIDDFRRLYQPVHPNDRDKRQMASVESASEYFSRKDLKQ